MFLASFPAGPWAANCYLVGADRECVVIDPGVDAADGVRGAIAEHGLRVAAILLTHGHIDHVASAAELGDELGVDVHIHPSDRLLLTEPARGLAPDMAALLGQMLGFERLPEPARLRLLADGDRLDLAGLGFEVVHAPGHTPGSVLFRTRYDGSDEISDLVFSGDVLFAGSIGRTDLPGGDPEAMAVTLRERVLTLPDTAAVLPGHGGTTSMARERAVNPYLHVPA